MIFRKFLGVATMFIVCLIFYLELTSAPSAEYINSTNKLYSVRRVSKTTSSVSQTVTRHTTDTRTVTRHTSDTQTVTRHTSDTQTVTRHTTDTATSGKKNKLITVSQFDLFLYPWPS